MGWVDTSSVAQAGANTSGMFDSSGWVVTQAAKGAAVTTATGGAGAVPPWLVLTAVAAGVVLLWKKKG